MRITNLTKTSATNNNTQQQQQAVTIENKQTNPKMTFSNTLQTILKMFNKIK